MKIRLALGAIALATMVSAEGNPQEILEGSFEFEIMGAPYRLYVCGGESDNRFVIRLFLNLIGSLSRVALALTSSLYWSVSNLGEEDTNEV